MEFEIKTLAQLVAEHGLPRADVVCGGGGCLYARCSSRKALNRVRRAVAGYLDRWGILHTL